MKPLDLSIIVVNWNSLAYLRKGLASIYAAPPRMTFEVIVVDNASFDGSGDMMAVEFPQGRFIQSRDNLGFAGANNLGFLQSSGRVVLLLNPDTEVKPGALDALWQQFSQLPDAGVVGVRLLNTDGTVQTSCIQRFPTVLNQTLDVELLRNAFPKLVIWGIWPLLEKQSAPVEVEVISGACMMLAREKFERVGMFTTDYFMYAEDLDLCYKCRQAGFRNYYTDEAVVVHHGGVSTSANGQSNFSAVMMRVSLFQFFSLRYGKFQALAYRVSVVLIAAARSALLALMALLPGSRERQNAQSRWAAIFCWGIGLSTPQNARAGKTLPASSSLPASRQ